MNARVLSVDELVDGQRFSRFNANLMIWSFLAMIADGFDLAALASAAPELARTWHVAAKSFAPALSASAFGILLGAPLLGSAGDRFGRRIVVVAGSTVFGLGTLATVWANDIGQVVMLRFLTGVGLGGLMPNLICLNAELAPRRLRATLVTVMFAGISLGGGIPGYVQAWLIPQYGWRIMFWIGGLAPLAVAGCLMFALPESVKYLMGRPHRRSELLATVRRLRRDLSISETAQFVDSVAPQVRGFALRQLFRGSLAWITPLLWVCFASALMTNFFLNSWLPLIFADSGLGPRQAGVATSLYHYGGLVGGVLVSLALARFGFAVIALLFLLAVPAIAAIGLPDGSYITMATTTGLAGFCVLGAQFGNIAAAGLLYPTEFRSLGVGWALAFGRVGSIAGPLLGGLLIDTKLPLQQLFLLAAVPMATGLIAASSIVGLSYWRIGRMHFDGLHGCIDRKRGVSAAVARRVG